jgi:hypothetical protein
MRRGSLLMRQYAATHFDVSFKPPLWFEADDFDISRRIEMLAAGLDYIVVDPHATAAGSPERVEIFGWARRR